jgi:D-sedoheptulose 7-phosphate isomerase
MRGRLEIAAGYEGNAGSMDLKQFFEAEFEEHAAVVAATRRDLAGDFSRLVEICATSTQSGGKILFFGNGGSAGDAQHLATELS